MIEPVFLRFAIVVLVLQCAYLTYVYWLFQRTRAEKSLIERMESYALLKGGGNTYSPDFLLTPSGHEVLLGTLKKVEQKNAVLVGFLVFFFTIFATVVFSDSSGGDGPAAKTGSHYDVYGLFTVVLAVALLLPLYLAFQGIKQIDQSNYWDQMYMSRRCAARQLQRSLMEDLLRKEKGFHFSRNVTFFSLFFYIAVLALDAFNRGLIERAVEILLPLF